MHLLAQPVDAAVAEDGPAQLRLRLLEAVRDPAVPGLDAFRPVAADVRHVAVLLRRDQERSSQKRSGLRSAVRGATAMPSSSVKPLQKTALSGVRMETRAPSTGVASSSRVTITSVRRGLSLTVSPRFVTWTTDERALGSLGCGVRASGRPSFSAAHTSPVPESDSTGRRSMPKDWMVSPFGVSRRTTGAPGGLSRKDFSWSARTAGMRSEAARGASHWETVARLRA